MLRILQIDWNFHEYRYSLLAFVTALLTALLIIPFLIRYSYRYKWFDVPDSRKEHQLPVPTMGGIALFAGMILGYLVWSHFPANPATGACFLSLLVLLVIGMLDDLKHIPARYKLMIQIGISLLVSSCGIRITNFDGLFGIYALPVSAQYIVTILTITGITNAFNLIDGVDGLAGGLGFMSLMILGLFLGLSGDKSSAMVAYSLAGGLLGFLYFNLHPARIFMGDTGSLILGFVISVLCVRLMGLNSGHYYLVLPHAPLFALSIVAIPVFDALRVFALRIRKGKSPFSPDKTHIHHLFTNNGWSHSFTSMVILFLHGLVLIIGYFLNKIPQAAGIFLLFGVLMTSVFIFRQWKPGSSQESVVSSR